ncbi:hypothetical protein [Micromonospora echinospora]
MASSSAAPTATPASASTGRSASTTNWPSAYAQAQITTDSGASTGTA